ncbi:hypothetical protein QIH01_02960 [Brevibacillus brevis]|uniref:hypothetical protein n=1 Tax=Brevibacillus formosus TaxID=54913 RepID=UPI001CA55CBA|nr:hypothetical protein [Brevibacillus formosus]MBW5471700.1 hypothetical protein [Brevibacillus formosus]WGV60116.1 hypothetical protein QIH01_02960 [Brevibacillus brevis]
MFKKSLALFLALSVLLNMFSVVGFAMGAGDWEDLGKGIRVRLDAPTAHGDAKWHVHVYDGNTEIAAESCDGTKSHGQKLEDCLSKKLANKVREGKLYKEGAKKQKKLEEAKQEIVQKNLNLYNSGDLVIAAGIVAGALGYKLWSLRSGKWLDFILAI